MAELWGRIGPRSLNKQLGDRFGVTLELSNPSGPPVPVIYLSATFSAYDSSGVATINAQNVVMVQTYTNGSMQLRYMVDARPNQTITVAGVYRYVYTVKMTDGDTQVFEQSGLISATP